MRVNDEQISVADSLTVLKLLRQKEYPFTRIAVEVNGIIVPNAKYRTYGLHNDDVVEIVCFARGGLSV